MIPEYSRFAIYEDSRFKTLRCADAGFENLAKFVLLSYNLKVSAENIA